MPDCEAMTLKKQDGEFCSEITKCGLTWAIKKQCVCAPVVGHNKTTES